MPIFTLALLLFAAPAEFQQIDEVDGIRIESRPVEGSSFVELRMTALTDATVDSLCAAAFGDGSIDPSETEVKLRRVLEEKPDERIIYDQISAPVVSDRDYAVRIQRIRDGQSCGTVFEAVNSLAPPLPEGFVRIEKLRGSWRFEPDPSGKTRAVYTALTDPGGSVPAFLAEGSRRKIGLRWVKLILSRGKRS